MQRTLVDELEHDLRGDDLGDDAGKLIGRTASKDEVFELVLGRHVAELGAQFCRRRRHAVDHTVVRVDRSAELVVPLGAKGLHRVGVAVEVDDPLMFGRHTVEGVAHDPHEVSVVVEPHVVCMSHGLDVDDRVAQEVEPPTLVVRQARARVTTIVDRSVDVVGRDANRLLQDGDRERSILLGKFGDPAIEPFQIESWHVECGHVGHQSPPVSTAARSGTFAVASRAMITYTFLLASRATATRKRSITPGLTSAPMSAGRQ